MKNTEVYFGGITTNLIVAEVQKLTGDITKFKWIPTEDMEDTLIK